MLPSSDSESDKKDTTPDKQTLKTAPLIKGGNRNVTTKELPGLNHLFQECKNRFTG
jgi:hypothetical protein